MAKTITLRVDETTYNLIRKAAAGERRSLSNFIEHATISYVSAELFADEAEMEEIRKDSELVGELNSGKADIERGDYTVV